MEVPVINRVLTESLTNPNTLIPSMFTIFPHRLFKWGALFLALAYAFTSLAHKIKLIILHYHNKSKALLAATEPLLPSFDSDFSDIDSDENEVVSSSEDDDDDDERCPTSSYSSYEDFTSLFDDFIVKGTLGSSGGGRKGKLRLRRRKSFLGEVEKDKFSLRELVNQNGVVKLWEGCGLNLPSVKMSPSVVITAGNCDYGVMAGLGLGVWDLRSKDRKPAVQGTWRSDRKGRVVGVDRGLTGKVYVRDDESMRVRVGDVRMMDGPVGEDDWEQDDVVLKDE